jgi:putative PIN family toxin of toxin-antitoxin system
MTIQMMTNKRFVLDTNVIVSAVLFPNSQPNLAIKQAQNIGTIIQSPATWLELEKVLARPKFDRYVTQAERQAFLLDFSQTIDLILENSFTTNECRDPKDNKYLELAVNGKAEYIITGDQDLLVLHPFRSVNILKVEEFLCFYS